VGWLGLLLPPAALNKTAQQILYFHVQGTPFQFSERACVSLFYSLKYTGDVHIIVLESLLC